MLGRLRDRSLTRKRPTRSPLGAGRKGAGRCSVAHQCNRFRWLRFLLGRHTFCPDTSVRKFAISHVLCRAHCHKSIAFSLCHVCMYMYVFWHKRLQALVALSSLSIFDRFVHSAVLGISCWQLGSLVFRKNWLVVCACCFSGSACQ